MPALRELQAAFSAAVLDRQDPATLGLALAPADERLARRLMVYRVNARENFATALEDAFPLLRAAMGDAGFRSMAFSYQRAHPAPSGNLFDVGRRLHGFLATALSGTPEAWLIDIARLEWAIQESLVAADGAPRFDAAALASVSAEEHASLCFTLHPSVRLLALGHPVFDLWQAQQAATGRPAIRPPAAHPERLLVRRAGDGIELWRLEEPDDACLCGIAAGEDLATITGKVLERAPDADLGAVLTCWARRGVITGIRRGGDAR